MSSRSTVIIISSTVGAVLGGAAAWAYTQARQEKLAGGASTGQQLHLQASAPDYVKIAVAVVALVRQITDLFKPG